MLRNLVKESAFLYSLWFALIGTRITKGRITLPKPTDDFFFAGFPRSGNTYLANLMAHCFPDLTFTHHHHNVGTIKIALSKNLKTLVIIRDPLDSVGSLLAYQSGDLDTTPTQGHVRRLMDDYYRYFRYLNDKKDDLYFISFKNMISDKKSTIEGIAEKLGLQDFKLTDEMLEDYDLKMRELESKKDISAGTFPNEQKRAYKARVSKLIRADAYFSQCSGLFDTLEASTTRAVQ